MPSSRRTNLLKQVERAIAAAADVSSLLRQLEPAQEPTAIIKARFSEAVRNLIAQKPHRRSSAGARTRQEAPGCDSDDESNR